MLWCIDFFEYSGYENEAIFKKVIQKVCANEQNKQKLIEFILANLNKRVKIIKVLAWISLDIEFVELTRICIE